MRIAADPSRETVRPSTRVWTSRGSAVADEAALDVRVRAECPRDRGVLRVPGRARVDPPGVPGGRDRAAGGDRAGGLARGVYPGCERPERLEAGFDHHDRLRQGAQFGIGVAGQGAAGVEDENGAVSVSGLPDLLERSGGAHRDSLPLEDGGHGLGPRRSRVGGAQHAPEGVPGAGEQGSEQHDERDEPAEEEPGERAAESAPDGRGRHRGGNRGRSRKPCHVRTAGGAARRVWSR
ncbi:hypothetical protein O159_22450 [Leifsonia xyli subsp. cynodontis DSM 46306]|uniref:Uncharacterized protein n=1 Tax=Leifsonia xyli subsp. cynodontis DSM 46306 TaxID=1389489 RepID=U3P7D0_LEIXC|nr:hypothetical protein O159_22450 [Leifsonia xyli subsp. cynodontis DSM 46306]